MYTKSILSGNVLEIYEYEKASPISRRRKCVRETPNRGRINDTPKRRYDSVKRTKRQFRRIVRAQSEANGSPALVTLTMLEIVSVEYGAQCLNAFFKTLKSDLSCSVEHIGVIEFQRRGAIHYHILIWGLPSNIVINERVNRYLQACWGKGYVDCIPTDGSPKLAGYLSKYMLKAVGDSRLFGKRSYHCSRDILRPRAVEIPSLASFTKEILGVDNRLVYQKSYDTLFNGRCHYKLLELLPYEN